MKWRKKVGAENMAVWIGGISAFCSSKTGESAIPDRLASVAGPGELYVMLEIN